MSYIPKLLHVKQSMQVLTSLKKIITLEQFEEILKSCPPSPTQTRKRKGFSQRAKSVLIKNQLVKKIDKNSYCWAEYSTEIENQMLTKADIVLRDYVAKMNERKKEKKQLQKTKNDIIHEPMLFDSVMREQEQRVVSNNEKRHQLYKLIGELFIELSQLK
jgi:hypothetical protein